MAGLRSIRSIGGTTVRHRFLLAACATALVLGAAPSASATHVFAGKAAEFEISKPVRALAPALLGQPKQTPVRVNPLGGKPDHGQRGTWTRGTPPTDPLLREARGAAKPTPPL